MVKDLEQQAKKPKRKVRFETEPEVANMVEQTLCTMTYKCLQQLRVWWRPTMGRMAYPVL